MTAARIDVHQHLVPEPYREALRAAGITTAGGRALPDWTPESAMALMDEVGIAAGVVSVSTPGIEAGYEGWWELEIFSDDGTFGRVLPDSYWAMPPRDFLGQAKEAFDRSYLQACEQARRPRP